MTALLLNIVGYIFDQKKKLDILKSKLYIEILTQKNCILKY